MARACVLSTFLLAVGCGENVLVGNLQLRSLNDAGADIAEAIEADAGPNPQAASSAQAWKKAKGKANHDNDRH